MESEVEIEKQASNLAKQFGRRLEISVSKNSWRKSVDEFRRAAVIKLATGEGFNVFALANILKKAWGLEDKDVDIEEIPANMAVAKFRSLSKLEEVLEGGPWTFHNQLVIVKRWVIGKKPENLDFNKIHIWLQLHNVPQEYMADAVTKEIAEGVGRVIRGRQEEAGVKKRKFARYRIELDINQEIPDGAMINLEDGDIEPFWVDFRFERLPSLCDRCRVLAHKSSNCPLEEKESLTEEPDGVAEGIEEQTGRKLISQEEGEVGAVAVSGGEVGESETDHRLSRGSGSINGAIFGMENGDNYGVGGGCMEALMDVVIKEDEGFWSRDNQRMKINLGKRPVKEKDIGPTLSSPSVTCSWSGGGISWPGEAQGPTNFKLGREGSLKDKGGTRSIFNVWVKRGKAKTKQGEARYHPYQLVGNREDACGGGRPEDSREGVVSGIVWSSDFNLGSAEVAQRPRRDQ